MPNTGTDRGRTATCLAQHGLANSPDSAQDLSMDIARSITEWAGKKGQDSAEAVAKDWEALAVWGTEYRLRDDDSVVATLGLEGDGRLRVRDKATGTVRFLIAEYLH